MLSKDDPTMCKWGAVCSANTLKKEAWVGKFVQEECVRPPYLWTLLAPYLWTILAPYLWTILAPYLWTLLAPYLPVYLPIHLPACVPSSPCLSLYLPSTCIAGGSSRRVAGAWRR